VDSSNRELRQPAAAVSPAMTYLAVALAWLVPGAGHVFLGRRGRGVGFLLIVLATIGLGCALQGELYRSIGQPLDTLATLACAGMGLPYFLLYGLGYTGNIDAAGYEYGKAFVLTAGLMNILLILDTWDIARGDKE
jgi:TM2 domain-containing membrane protein YozV